MSACGFIKPAKTLSSSSGPCSHMPHQCHSYFSCSELQNPQSSTDQRPLLPLVIMIMWILIDEGDYYHILNILLYCPACVWLNLENSKQVIVKECWILLSVSSLHSPGTWGCPTVCTFIGFQLKNLKMPAHTIIKSAK